MLSVSTFTSIISQLLLEPHAGLLSGILFGVKQTLDPELKNALIATGTLHIVALSGMNITILTTLVIQSFLLVFPRRIAIISAFIVVIGFILFVGPSPSVIRAGIMGGLTLVGVFFGKPVFALWSWGIAVVLMLIVTPMWITDLSFQLSVLASLGMIVFGSDKQNEKQVFARHPGEVQDLILDAPSACQNDKKKCFFRECPIQGMDRYIIHQIFHLIRSDLHTTLSAQTLTIPLLFFTFGRLSLISPLTNVLIVWTLPIITVLGFLVALGGWIFLPMGQVSAWFAWIFLEYILEIITWTARIPGASLGG